MRLETARPGDLPALRALWKTCFGDADDYVNLYFEHAFRPERVFVLRKETRPLAMAISFPLCWRLERQALPGAYLYAVCTAPEARGNGYFRALLRFAEQRLEQAGCAFVCLRPGSAALWDTYGRMGYLPAFTNRCLSVAADCSCGTLTPLSPAAYRAQRSALLQGPWVDWPEDALSHQARLGQLFTAQADGLCGVGAAERWGGEVILKEYLGDEALLPAICAALGAASMQVRTPGTEQGFAQAKPLGGADCPFGYLGFAFD